MNRYPNTRTRTFDFNRLPQEPTDMIVGLLRHDARSALALVSRRMEEMVRARQWAEIRFRSDRQQVLANDLRLFEFKCQQDKGRNAGRPFFSTYIKGATIELTKPPPHAGGGDDLASFRFGENGIQYGYEHDDALPRMILQGLSLMPHLTYLKLTFPESSLSDNQCLDLLTRMRSTDKWESVKYLSISGGYSVRYCLSGIIEEMVPKLEGLHLQLGSDSGMFDSAVDHHPDMKRLALTVSPRESRAAQAFYTQSLADVSQHFQSVDTLMLFSQEGRRPITLDSELADRELDDFLEIAMTMSCLRRLAIQITPGFFYTRSISMQLQHGEAKNHYLEWYSQLMRRFESIPQLHSLVIAVEWPLYFEGVRKDSNSSFVISTKNGNEVRRAAWPLSIRD